MAKLNTAAAGMMAAALLAGCAGQPDKTALTLTILHTNDFHSRLQPVDARGVTCDPAAAATAAEADATEGDATEGDAPDTACFGGSARLASAIDTQRSAVESTGGHVLLLDGGDQFQGSLFYTYYKGEAAAEMMNRLGYDAMTAGNHEFDDGPEVLRGFIDAVEFPVLLANANVSAEPQLASALKPSVVVRKGDSRIGLIGVAPAGTGSGSSAGPNVSFSDPIPALEREVAVLEQSGVNKIVLLSHSGYEVDKQIAATVPGVDVIVGGHDNTFLSNFQPDAKGPYPTLVEGPGGANVAIVQAGAYGRYLGELTVDWDETGAVTAAYGEPLVMDAAIPEDEAIAARVAELAAPLDALYAETVGAVAGDIGADPQICREKLCEMGVLVAEAMLEAGRAQGVEIAIHNAGGLRAPLGAGDVTRGDVLTVLPFGNTLSVFKLTGADVVAALENGVSEVESLGGRFPQIAGARYAWSASKPAGEGRVQAVQVNRGGEWVNIDLEETYVVAANSFMRAGGDGYTVLAENAVDAYDFGPSVADVVIAYLQGGPYLPALDDRIVRMR